MSRRSRLLAALSAGAASAGCTHTNVRTDFDPSAEFSRYHTYSWADGRDVGGGRLEIPLPDKRIKDIVGRQLWSKNLSDVSQIAKPDLIVLYWIGLKDKTIVDSAPSPSMSMRAPWNRYDPYWTGRWGRTYDEVVVRNYGEVTLIVDLIDAGTKELSWRAYLVQAVDKDPQKTAERVTANATAAFVQYPPTK
jgi:hypothetical protein